MKRLDDHADLDMPMPAEELLRAVGFEPRVLHRIAEYLETRHLRMLTPRQFMDLFLPPVLGESYYIPIIDHPQFGTNSLQSAVLSICEADLGKAFQGLWAARVYFMKVQELRWTLPRQAAKSRRAAPPSDVA